MQGDAYQCCLPQSRPLSMPGWIVMIVLINKKREQPGGQLWEPSDVEHHHLRQVEMYHFRMVQTEIALARLLLARSPSLQTITFCHGNLLPHPDWTVEYLEAGKDWNTEQKSAITRRLATSSVFGVSLEFRS